MEPDILFSRFKMAYIKGGGMGVTKDFKTDTVVTHATLNFICLMGNLVPAVTSATFN